MNSMIERGPYGAQFCLYIPPDSQEIDFQLELMMTERPDFLLPVFRQISMQGPRYAYPVTGSFSLSDLIAGKRLNRQQAKSILLQLKNVLQTLPDHLLSSEQVLITPETLFVTLPDLQIRLVYQPFLPVAESDSVEQLVVWLGNKFFQNRLMRCHWEKQFNVHMTNAKAFDRKQCLIFALAAAQLAALILTALQLIFHSWFASLQSNLRIPLLIFFLMTVPIEIILMFPGLFIKKSKSAEITSNSNSELTGNSSNSKQCFSKILKRLNPVAAFNQGRAALKKRAEKSEAHLGRVREMPTELLSSKQETFRLATLSEGMIGTAAETAGQRAFILMEEFVIGRDFRTVDLCLSGYTVGRRHAQINRRGATFFITDLGSKNGTRLNGERLNKLVEYRLPDRCQIQFADRLFYFEAEELLDQGMGKAS